MSTKSVLVAVVALVVGVVIGAAVQTAAPLGGVTIEDETFLGAVTFSGGLTSTDVSVTDDAAVAEDLQLTKSPFCVEFYATSSATLNKLVASTTATIEGSDGVIMFTYGSCAS
jgi:hypothetical protein